MKVIVILDQIQAGLGGKERADTPLGGQRIAMGAADTLEKNLKKVKGDIIGTFYCGTDYYRDNVDVVKRKFGKMAEKMGADVVVFGPTYDYPEFSAMACELALAIQTDTSIPVLVASAIEKNEALIPQFQDQLLIVKTPKKGGTGLQDSLDHLVEGCQVVTENGDVASFKANYCFN